MIDRDNFHKRLKALMEQHQMTQADLAAEIWGRLQAAEDFDAEGFSERATELMRQIMADRSKNALIAKGRDRLSVWVSGKSFPSPENLEKLAKALGVSVRDLAP
jgi:transcriptional regulator with XRE-family HTH domain